MGDAPDGMDLQEELLEQFLRFDKLGMRREAREAVLNLVASVCGSNAEDAWTRDNLDRLPLNNASRIRHEIFQSVVFPSLKAKVERGDPEASYLLGKHFQNLISDSALHERIGYRSNTELFRDAYNSNPSSAKYGGAYLDSVIETLRYTFHEWPTGILIEHTNWRQELRGLRATLSLAMSLDRRGEYKGILAKWSQITDQYEDRLAEKGG